MHNKFFVYFLVAGFGLVACSHVSRTIFQATPSATSLVQVSVGSSMLGVVNDDFLGFSYEKSILSSPLFRSDNAPLLSLFSKWGPSVLRIGGNTVNKTTWNPTGPGLVAGQTAPADIDRLAVFLTATQWKVIYGLNATTSSPALSTQEAVYVAHALGDRLLDFEIGNEPDLYYQNGLKPATYAFSNFLADWDSYVASIRKALPGVNFSGPASAYNAAVYTVPFAAARNSRLELLTQHYYRANGQVPASTIDFLLTPDLKLPDQMAVLRSSARSNDISKGYRIAEANSFYNGGAPGISNGFGTALWMIEYCFTLAENGASGVNFHGGGSGTGYTPIGNDQSGRILGARAEYYGMLLFSLMTPGKVLQTTTTGDNPSFFTTYATLKSDGLISLVLINSSRTEVVSANVGFPASTTSAQSISLIASSLDATTGMTLGGSAIGADGSWSPVASTPILISGSGATIDVPPSSAVLVTYRQ